MNIKLFDSNDIEQMEWENTKDGIFSKTYLEAIIKNSAINYIDNTDTEMQLLSFEDNFFPLAITKDKPTVKNSYVCSPTGHYIDYAKEEINIELKDKKLLKNASLKSIELLENSFKKREFEKVVYVNNWLLSTNLYTDFDLRVLPDIKKFLIENFPDKAIIFRSINDMYNQDIYQQLNSLGFKHIFSRQVYILDPKKGIYKKKESYQKDLKVKRKSKYHWEDADSVTPEQYSRIRYLYDDLYIKKYSPLNPTFNENFIKETIKKECFNYKVLKKDGEIYAVFGYFERGGFITAPLFGYDTAVDPKDGLYRLTALKILEDAIENNWIVHQSSGVSKFKMYRGAEPSIEYNMVYYQHLPKKQQLPWKMLHKLTDYAVIPIMKKYEL